MRKIQLLIATAGLVILTLGCAYIPSGTNLGAVAKAAQLQNVTTGDGTFENYTATGHYTATEVGIGVGIPFLFKVLEIYPFQSNEDLLAHAAYEAKRGGANAMINVNPHSEFFTGIPFFFLGVYVDKAAGTGIKNK